MPKESTGDKLEQLQVSLDTLIKTVNKTQDKVVRLEEWVDVVSSPLYKRIYFWLRGWRWKTLGRWWRNKSQWPGPADKWWLS